MFFRVFLRNEMGNHIGLNNIDKKPSQDKLWMNPATGLIIQFHFHNEEWEAYHLTQQTKRVFFLKGFPAAQEADLLTLMANDVPPVLDPPPVFVPTANVFVPHPGISAAIPDQEKVRAAASAEEKKHKHKRK